MKTVRFLLIGLGPHSKRIYLPFFQKYGKALGIEIVLGVDVESKENDLRKYLEEKNIFLPDLLFVPAFREKMPQSVVQKLNALIEEKKIDAVIIATEPSSHVAYGIWALQHKIPTLMDKPISARYNSVSNILEAKQLFEDFQILAKEQRLSQSLFVVNSQRRYHPGMRKVYELIEEIAQEFGMPVTSIQSSDADGQWFFPEEILHETYHGYNHGYGKCSHSGYHYFDTVYQLYKAGRVANKYADRMKVYSSFIQPDSFLQQITQVDYKQWFGDEYQSVHSDSELQNMVQNFGEIDFAATLTFLKDKLPLCNVQLNMIHNSFCRRAWVKANADLYKSNGRVKHEFHVIQQGPLQTIQIHGYQVSSSHEKNDIGEFDFGGNNHFDVNVFRNSGVVGGKALELYATRSTNPDRITIDEDIPVEQLTYEYARDLAVKEFVGLLRGSPIASCLSPLQDHEVPAQMMSLLYQSHILQSVVEGAFEQERKNE